MRTFENIVPCETVGKEKDDRRIRRSGDLNIN